MVSPILRSRSPVSAREFWIAPPNLSGGPALSCRLRVFTMGLILRAGPRRCEATDFSFAPGYFSLVLCRIFHFLIPTPPTPPVWHTSVSDCEGFKGGPHTFSIPRPYRMHTSHTFSRKLCRFSGRKVTNAAEIVRRKEGMVERIWNEYALRGGNYRQSWRKYLRSVFSGLRWFSMTRLLTMKRKAGNRE